MFKILKFLKELNNFNDPEFAELKNKTRRQLKIGLRCFLIDAISFIIFLAIVFYITR
jgi:hypothetical protein